MQKQFIFSNNPKYILARHFTFWAVFLIICFITGAYPYKPKDLLNSHFYFISLIWVASYVPVAILCTYLFLKLVLPFVSKKRDFFKILWAICIASLFTIIVSCLLNKRAILWYEGTANKDILQESLQLIYFHSIVFTILLTCIITGIIVIKNWYLQVAENAKLYKQKIYNELNVLKCQVYPAFLFNSLKNLRNQLDCSGAKAAKLLLNLSDILSYILYDSENELVLLKKEIMTIKKFIEVIKEDRVNDIVFADNIPEDSYDKYVQPLILFSLLETVLSETDNITGEEPSIQIFICSENNDVVEFTVSCYFEEQCISNYYHEKRIKKIQDRLTIFPRLDKKLKVIKNNNSVDFSVLIETTDSFNFSHNGQGSKN